PKWSYFRTYFNILLRNSLLYIHAIGILDKARERPIKGYKSEIAVDRPNQRIGVINGRAQIRFRAAQCFGLMTSDEKHADHFRDHIYKRSFFCQERTFSFSWPLFLVTDFDKPLHSKRGLKLGRLKISRWRKIVTPPLNPVDNDSCDGDVRVVPPGRQHIGYLLHRALH